MSRLSRALLETKIVSSCKNCGYYIWKQRQCSCVIVASCVHTASIFPPFWSTGMYTPYNTRQTEVTHLFYRFHCHGLSHCLPHSLCPDVLMSHCPSPVLLPLVVLSSHCPIGPLPNVLAPYCHTALLSITPLYSLTNTSKVCTIKVRVYKATNCSKAC